MLQVVPEMRAEPCRLIKPARLQNWELYDKLRDEVPAAGKLWRESDDAKRAQMKPWFEDLLRRHATAGMAEQTFHKLAAALGVDEPMPERYVLRMSDLHYCVMTVHRQEERLSAGAEP